MYLYKQQRNTEYLIDACEEVDSEVNTEKTEYMMMSHNRNAERNLDMEMTERFFEIVAKFIVVYLSKKSRFDYEKIIFG
jgi:hypothetical protein